MSRPAAFLPFFAGASRSTIQKVIGEARDAINSSPDLRLDNIHFPLTNEDCKKMEKEFTSCSLQVVVLGKLW